MIYLLARVLDVSTRKMDEQHDQDVCKITKLNYDIGCNHRTITDRPDQKQKC